MTRPSSFLRIHPATLRRTFLSAIAVAAAGSLAACGGSSDGPTEPPPTGGGVASVAVSPSTASVAVGATTTLSATPKDASGNAVSGQTITWSTDNGAVATVTSGVVTGVAAGTAHITAAVSGKQAQVTVTVTPVSVASIALSATTGSVQVGSTLALTATPKDANGNAVSGQTITWSSDATGVATVSATGVVTGVAPGTANITASAGGKQGTATVTVTPIPVAAVTITASTTSLLAFVVDTTLSVATIQPVLKDAAGNTLTGRVVTYTSSDTTVAKVSATGVVTAVGPNVPGQSKSVTITATSEGKSGSVTLTVLTPSVAQVVVTPATSTIKVGQNEVLDVQAKDSQGHPLAGRVFQIAVSPNGVVSAPNNQITGTAPGTATVTFQAEGVTGSATVTVTP